MTRSGAEEQTGETQQPAGSPRRRRVPRWVVWMIGVALAVVAAVGVAVEYVVHNAEPILRRRVIATLEQRFHSPVELDALHISVFKGLEVSGSGLRIRDIAGSGTQPADGPPMVSVDSFEFRTGIRQLMEPTTRVQTVRVQGMRLNIPPKGERGPLLAHAQAPHEPGQQPRPKTKLIVDQIVCSDATLTIETNKPGKQPLVFDIRDLTLRDVGAPGPMPFEARLVNPKPVGDIHSTGHLGDWNEEEPRDTALDGVYSFTNADLGTIKGIAGTLSSTGNFGGTLGEIGVTGSTDTPDFALDSSEHPVALHTDFNATVDGTTGDTKLNHVHATLLHTVLEVSGTVMRAGPETVPGNGLGKNVPGHFIDISVSSDHARVEDILRLAVKTSPPLMQGGLALRAHLTIPPGHVSVSRKMRVEGTFKVHAATLANAHWQQTVDDLSARAPGNPREKGTGDTPVVESQLDGNFALANAVVDIPKLNYEMPGAQVALGGKYSLDGNTFDFAGTVRTQATASQMLTGWKSVVAMPFDKLLKKNGAGLEIPVTVSGTKSDPKFGVDLGKLTGQIFHRNKKDDQPAPDQQQKDDQAAPVPHP